MSEGCLDNQLTEPPGDTEYICRVKSVSFVLEGTIMQHRFIVLPNSPYPVKNLRPLPSAPARGATKHTFYLCKDSSSDFMTTMIEVAYDIIQDWDVRVVYEV